MEFTNNNNVTHQLVPMRKPPTGEPCAGEPHARFGGRGEKSSLPLSEHPPPLWERRLRRDFEVEIVKRKRGQVEKKGSGYFLVACS